MPDMLIKLYDFPWNFPIEEAPPPNDVLIRKPIGAETQLIVAWVKSVFGGNWASEAQTAVSAHPFSCYIALQNSELVGFCCYDATALGFIGPIGVMPGFRRKGVGGRLLLSCCKDMKINGYGYAVVGGVEKENADFYRKIAGATIIPESKPGLYKEMLMDRK